MSQFVTDTHPLVWHLTNEPRLSQTARTIFTAADAGLHQVLVPGIVLIEMVYLVEKKILATNLLNGLLALLNIPNGSYAIAPLDHLVTQTMLIQVPWPVVPELADRIITATAITLNVPLITKDAKILQSNLVVTLW